jgi:hypothetical protein
MSVVVELDSDIHTWCGRYLSFFTGCRTWHKRWVISSREAIVFAKADADKECDGRVIDVIPLSEVEGVCYAEIASDPWQDAGQKKPEHEQKSASLRRSAKFGSSNKIKFLHSFQIRTAIDGYNSGRTYHLQAASAEQCAELADKIAAAATAAKKSKEAKTRFEWSQVCAPVGFFSLNL